MCSLLLLFWLLESVGSCTNTLVSRSCFLRLSPKNVCVLECLVSRVTGRPFRNWQCHWHATWSNLQNGRGFCHVARHCSATFSLDKNRIKNGLLSKLNEILPHIRAYNSIIWRCSWLFYQVFVPYMHWLLILTFSTSSQFHQLLPHPSFRTDSVMKLWFCRLDEKVHLYFSWT